MSRELRFDYFMILWYNESMEREMFESQDDYEARIICESYDIVEAIVDEEKLLDANIWSIDWADLDARSAEEIEEDGVMIVERARQFIKDLYFSELTRSYYPHLAEAQSEDELMMSMAMIETMPEIGGRYSLVTYQLDDGTERNIEKIEAECGINLVTRYSIVNNDVTNPENNHIYYIEKRDGMGYRLMVGNYREYDDDQREMLEAVHPTVREKLRAVVDGAANPNEVNMLLTEVRAASSEMLSDEALDALDVYARAQYQYQQDYEKLRQDFEPNLAPELDKIIDMHDILADRYIELGLNDK